MDTDGTRPNSHADLGIPAAPPVADVLPRIQGPLVEEALRHDSSVSLVARKYNVNANQVFAWRKQYPEGTLRGSRPEPTVGLPAPESGFLPVGVLSAARRTYRVEVKLPNGVAVRLDPDMPEAVLCKLVSALAGAL